MLQLFSVFRQPLVLKQRRFFTAVFKLLFSFIQFDRTRWVEFSKLVFVNTWVTKPSLPVGTKRLKNPIATLAKATPELRVLSLKQSLRSFKHVLCTLMSLGFIVSELRHKHRFAISFLFFFAANPNLIHVYKFSIYRASATLKQSGTRAI